MGYGRILKTHLHGNDEHRPAILLLLRKVIRKYHDSVTYLFVSVMSGFCIKILARESKLQLAVNQLCDSLSGVAISGFYPPTY